MRRHAVALFCVSLPLAAAFATGAQTASSSEQPTATGSASGIDLEALDRSTDPCSDFYLFACGGWEAKNPLPPDRPRWGRSSEVEERTFLRLQRILESSGGDPDLQQPRDYYAACMDQRTINLKGLGALKAELDRIEALEGRDGLPALVGRLHTIAADVPRAAAGFITFNAFFRFGSRQDLEDPTSQIATVDQDGLGLPSREFYVKTDPQSATLRLQYEHHISRMLQLAGEPPARADMEASAVLALETVLARASIDRASHRNPTSVYHLMEKGDLQALTPSFDWNKYLNEVAAPTFTRVNVAVPQFTRALNRVFAETPLDDLKAYLRWQLLHAALPMLPEPFLTADFQFFGVSLAGQSVPELRWRRCVADTDRRVGGALGRAFVQETLSPAARADVAAMATGIRHAMEQEVHQASWMGDDMKKAAITRLHAVVDRIGYPQRWRDDRTLRIDRSDALGNLGRAVALERRRDLDRIGRPVDRDEWPMTPPTVNADYSAPLNTMTLPAGMLQPPFYALGRDRALNYGALGAVIGHELTHGFDAQTPKNGERGSGASCLVNQYSRYTAAGDTKIDGRLTLGENAADNLGLRLALLAYLAGPGGTARPPDAFTSEQRFFLGYGQIWCEHRTPELERQRATTDVHAPGRYRVNGVVANMPAFQRAFSCRAGTPMVRAPACRVW